VPERIAELARLIDPDAWLAREEDQVTLGGAWEFMTRRMESTAAAERVAAAGYVKEKNVRDPDGLGEFFAARDEVVRAVLRWLSAEITEESAHAAAEAEYAEDLVGLAARRLVRAIENGPDDLKPVGWDDVAA
jgi:hypothetical protein